MTLQQIRYALLVADHGSASKAAAQLFVSQPSLTGSIKELERELGISIFTRSTRGMTPTADGEEFLRYARQVYQQYELLQQRFDGSSDRKRKFGVSTQHYSFAVKAFVEMVKGFDTLRYEFAIRETETLNVIRDVGSLRSEIGILYLSDFNRKIMEKLLRDHGLSFHPLIECDAHVYLWTGHPLAGERSIRFEQLMDYPCLSFEQGESETLFVEEEILGEKDYPRVIRASDRATMLNLMVGLNGYTLCSGIISDELNGNAFCVVPFEADTENRNAVMEIGYLVKKNAVLSEMGVAYLSEVRRFLGTGA